MSSEEDKLQHCSTFSVNQSIILLLEMKYVNVYISYNPCREMTAILQQMNSQFLCTEQMPKIIKKNTSGSSLLITNSPTAH